MIVCQWCNEVLIDDPNLEHGIIIGTPMHRECAIRSVVGSVAHQEKICHCFGGTGDDDPSISRREAARRAVALYMKKNAN